MPLLENIPIIKAGASDVTVMLGSVQVWPVGVSFVVSNVSVVYSSGTIIDAAGSNYAELRGTVTKYRGSQIIEIQNNVLLTPSRVSGSTYLTVDGNRIEGANRGQTTGAQRSAYFTGSYQGAVSSDQVLVSQQANSQQASTYEYLLSVIIDYSGNLPSLAGVYGASFESQRAEVLHFTSGDYYQSFEPFLSTISGVNCTPSISSGQGHGTFNIIVDRNGTTERTISLTIRAGSAAQATTSKTQDALVPVYANFTPTVSPAGVVSIKMHITGGTPVGTTLASNIAFHYQPYGSSEEVLFVAGPVTLEDNRARIISGITVPAGSGYCYFVCDLNNITDPTWIHGSYYVAGSGPGELQE